MTPLFPPETSGRTLRDEGLALIEQHAGAFVPVLHSDFPSNHARIVTVRRHQL